jgi:hypothetical protein
MKTFTALSLVLMSLSLVPACGGVVDDKDVSKTSEPSQFPSPSAVPDAPADEPAADTSEVNRLPAPPTPAQIEQCQSVFVRGQGLPSKLQTKMCAGNTYSGCVGTYCTPCAPAKCVAGAQTFASASGDTPGSICSYNCVDNVWESSLSYRSAPSGSSSSTPLVLAFDNAPVQFTQAVGAFDVAGRSASVGTDWVSARTPWLALDRNGNGNIDDGAELFGSMTTLASGKRANQGFEALAELDSNHDGLIDAKDASYSQLLLWSDRNQDRISQPEELQHLADAGVDSLSLVYSSRPACDAMNCEGERSGLTFRNAAGIQQGTLVDVYLGSQ